MSGVAAAAVPLATPASHAASATKRTLSQAQPSAKKKHRSAAHKKPRPGSSAHNSSASHLRDDAAPDVVIYGQREDVVKFGEQIATQLQLEPEWVLKQLALARYQPSVARLVMPPAAGTAKNWEAYRARFVEPQRLREGLRWWAENEAWLARAEAQWGVPASLVVAIVGVETFYGRQTGGYKVIDALATLSFDFPAGRSDRSAFYRDELAAFLRWCAREGRDLQQVRGSYAGAIGLPQFMPSSILNHAVDFDGDGRIDLDRPGADVVGSVANYLAQAGWQRSMPTHFAVKPPVDSRERALLLAPDILPSFTAEQMQEHGAWLEEAGQAHTGLLALVELQNGPSAPSYVAGTRNFWVVTRYNWSSYYALAVIELAQNLRLQRAVP